MERGHAITVDETSPPRFQAASFPGIHHYLSPRPIPRDRDVVALSFLGAAVRWLTVFASVLAMITAIYLIVDGVHGMGTGPVSRLLDLATHPLIGLLVGILATAAIQSSTTVTALTVAAVGSGAISVTMAVPIILGANIGTTITASIVAFSYVGRRGEFCRAFTSASLHTSFNLLFVLAMLPVELIFHPLQHLSGLLSDLLVGDVSEPTVTGGFVFSLFSPLVDVLGMQGVIGAVFEPRAAALACIVLGTVLVLVAVRVIGAQLSTLMAARSRTLIKRSTGASDFLGVATGTLVTMGVQASAVTVSSLLPFAAAKSMKLRELLMITVGANVGTTFTALLTALAVPGSLGPFALQAALIHLLFNLIGALLVLFVTPLRDLIIRLAEFGGRAAARSYVAAGAFLASFHLVIPAVILLGYATLN